MASYMDMVTVLMCLFIVLYAMSTVDQDKFAALRNSLATGFGSVIAQPIMRKYAPDEESVKNLSRDEAVKVVRECMKVLFYRDARSLDTYSIAIVTKDGVELHESEKLEDQSWAFADRIKGYGTQEV